MPRGKLPIFEDFGLNGGLDGAYGNLASGAPHRGTPKEIPLGGERIIPRTGMRLAAIRDLRMVPIPIDPACQAGELSHPGLNYEGPDASAAMGLEDEPPAAFA
jgi:hypothetical protein